IAGKPAPGRLDREYAGETRRIPTTRNTRAPLPPETEGLTFKQVRTVLERRQDSNLRWHGGITGDQPGLHLINVVARLELIAQDQAGADSGKTNPVVLIAAFVVAFDYRDFDGQQAPLPYLTIQKPHGAPNLDLRTWISELRTKRHI